MNIRLLRCLRQEDHTDHLQDKPGIKSFSSYIISQATRIPTLSQIKELLAAKSTARVGLILTERLINIPSEVVPPMYKMLLEEISWALEEKEPYNFTHYLVFSKTYREIASALDNEDAPKSKKQRKASKVGSSDVFYFHPEDEILHRYSVGFGSFEYQKEAGGPDAKRTFQELGVKPEGHMILIEAAKFEAAVKALQESFNQG